MKYGKGILALFLWLFSLFLLAGCGEKRQSVYDIARDGVVYTVDQEQQTISDGKYSYRYEVSGSSSGASFKIIYPNGSSFWWQKNASGGFGGWSDDYDESTYASGHTLLDILTAGRPRESEPKNVPAIILLILLGLFNAIAPETSWYLSRGWYYRDAEPSDEALLLYRGSGILCLVIAVLMILF